MRVPGFTARSSLYRSTAAYRSTGNARADKVSLHADMVYPQGGSSFKACSACKASCYAQLSDQAEFCFDVATVCAGVGSLTLGTLTIPCMNFVTLVCGFNAIQAMACLATCNEIIGCSPSGGGGNGRAPTPYCELHPEKCTEDGTPIPDRGCQIYTTGGWIPEGGMQCGGCCYHQECPGKPLEKLGCQCDCF